MKARLFVGNGSTIVGENDTVIVNAKDDYLHLPQKVMEFFRHALANFEFDWLFKCDDDTFVAVDRLAELACANHDYVGNEFLVDRGYASGGAGYLLKRSLLEKIVAESSYPETGDEDVIFGQLSMSNHAVTHATSKLCFDSSRIPRWDNDIVTCHWVSPEKMMALHVIHGSAPEFLVEAEHPLWQDHVLLFEKGYFARKSVADVGRWKWNEVNRELILEWFDYPSEIFSVSEGSKAKLVSGELENSQPEFRILIAICSERNRIESREAVRQTWLSNLPEGMQYTFFAGGGSPLSDEPDTVICDVEERPDLLTRKVLAFYEQVMKHHEFDWLFRCDDDTYVSLQRLASLVEPEFDLIGNEFIDLRGSPSAGAGYLISRKGIATVLDAASRDPSEGEEALVGRAVSMSGGRMKSSDRLQWDHSRQPRKYNSVITCHWCAPDRLRWIDAMFQGKPDREFLAVHRHWTDRLLFHSNGFFERGDNRDHGSWEEDPEGNLELKWKDWPAETVLRSESGYASGDMTLVEACRRNRRKSIGEDPILLDLRGIPIYGVSGRAYEARRLRLDKTLSKLGWYEPHYFTSELHRERGRAWSSITFNHLAAITSQEPPFIVLEDDAMPTQWLMDEIEIPFGCDAVWLGMTTYGMRNGESAADGAEFEGDPALPRISNMLGTHAILYLSKEFVAAVREALFALIQLNPITPHDRVLASMQAGWCIHGVNPPLFYQDDGHAPCVTNAPISLPGC